MGIESPDDNIEKLEKLLLALPTEEQSLFFYLREKVKSQLSHPDEGMLAEVPYSKEQSEFDVLYMRAENLNDLSIEKRLKLFMLSREEQNKYFELKQKVKSQLSHPDEGMLAEVPYSKEQSEFDGLNLKMEQLNTEQVSFYTEKFNGKAMDILDK